jgi:hypothetical protein
MLDKQLTGKSVLPGVLVAPYHLIRNLVRRSHYTLQRNSWDFSHPRKDDQEEGSGQSITPVLFKFVG